MGLEKRIGFEDLIQGKNSVLFKNGQGHILYEKPSNTIHAGSESEIMRIHRLIETIDFDPQYESISLQNARDDKFDSLLLNITEACNLRCGYCVYSGSYEGERSHNISRMSLDTISKALGIFVPNTQDEALIGFYGGEPLTQFGLIKHTIELAKSQFPDHNFVFSITSNFVDVEKYIDFIIDQGIHLQVSLDGPKEVHDKYRLTISGKPTHDKIIRNLDKIERISPGYSRTHVALNATYNETADFTAIVDYFLSMNSQFASMRVGAVEKKGSSNDQEEGSVLTSILDYAEIYTDSVANGEEPASLLKRFFDEPLRTVTQRSMIAMPDSLMLNGTCYPTKRKIFVNTGGLLYLCEKMGERLELGDVESGISQEHIDSAIDMFTDIRNSQCTDGCWNQRLCTPCFHTAKEPNAEMSSSSLAQSCDTYKIQSLLGIALYSTITSQNPKILGKYFAQ